MYVIQQQERVLLFSLKKILWKKKVQVMPSGLRKEALLSVHVWHHEEKYKT